MSARHSEQTPTDGIHVAVKWQYDDNTARDAASYAVEDIGGIAQVGASAPYTFYILANNTGPGWVEVGGSSGDSGGDSGAEYVVLTATGSLSSERVLSGSDGITITDGGAGNNVTLSTNIIGSGSVTVSTGANGQVTVFGSGGGGSFLALDGSTAMAGTIDMNNNEILSASTITFASEFNIGNGGGTLFVDWADGQKQRVTLTASATASFAAPSSVGSFLLKIIQDGTGSRTIEWPSSVKWAGGTAPTLTTTTGAIDIVTFYYDGTDYYAASGLNFQ